MGFRASLLLLLLLPACEGPDAFLTRRKVLFNDKAIFIHPENPIEIPAGNTVRIDDRSITIKGPEMITVRGQPVGVRGNTVTIGSSQFDASTLRKITIDRDGAVRTEFENEPRRGP